MKKKSFGTGLLLPEDSIFMTGLQRMKAVEIKQYNKYSISKN